jgi:hypothetical protein
MGNILAIEVAGHSKNQWPPGLMNSSLIVPGLMNPNPIIPDLINVEGCGRCHFEVQVACG